MLSSVNGVADVRLAALPPSGVGGIATGKKRAYLFMVGSLTGYQCRIALAKASVRISAYAPSLLFSSATIVVRLMLR